MKPASIYLAAVVLNSLWQAGVIAAAALLASRMAPRAPGHWLYRYWAAVTTLCAGVAWCTASWPHPATGTAAVNSSGVTFVLPDLAVAAVAVLFLALTAWRTGRLLRAFRHASQLRRQSRPETNPLIGRLAHELGLGDAGLRTSDRAPGPVTVGLLRPVIILPEGLLDRHGPEVAQAALAHEMVHVRRRDGARKLAEELVLLLVPWPPLAGWLRGHLDHARELAADEGAAGVLGGGRHYSRSLMAIAADVAGDPQPSEALCPMGQTDLELRVRQLLQGARRPSRWTTAGIATALAAGLLISARAGLVPRTEEQERFDMTLRPESARPGQSTRLPPPPPPPPPPPGK